MVPVNKEVASGRGYGEEVGSGVTYRKSESAGSTNADAFDRDARARSCSRARAKGFGGGEESVGGMGVNRNVRNRLVIRFGVVTMVLAMSFEC
jgi:hypothetical protein